jgi:hypothetical protein
MPSASDLQSFASFLASLSRSAPRGRAALVAPQDGVFGAARQLEQWCQVDGVSTVRACRTLVAAEAYIRGQRDQ